MREEFLAAGDVRFFLDGLLGYDTDHVGVQTARDGGKPCDRRKVWVRGRKALESGFDQRLITIRDLVQIAQPAGQAPHRLNDLLFRTGQVVLHLA
jgi:hypothetical protein